MSLNAVFLEQRNSGEVTIGEMNPRVGTGFVLVLRVELGGIPIHYIFHFGINAFHR